MSLTDISLDDLAIHFHPDMNLSSTIDAALQQKEALGSAMVNPTVVGDGTKLPSVLRVSLRRFAFVVDAMHNESVHNTFATTAFSNMVLVMEDFLSEADTIRKIAEMDTNAFTPMSYTGVSGGYVQASWSDFSVDFHMMSRRYFSADMLALDGYLYLAAADDDRFTVTDQYVELSDSSSTSRRELRLTTPAYVGIAGLTKISPAPSKIYTASTWKLRDLELVTDVVTDALMTDWLAEIDRCLPPNNDPSPPLQWWDNVRFWCHGTCTMVIDNLVVSTSRLSEPTTSNSTVSPNSIVSKAPVKLDISLRNLYMSVDRCLVELQGYNLDVTVEFEQIPKKRRPQVKQKHRITVRNPHLKEWRLCRMPVVAISLAHAPSHSGPPSYDHHDIYCRPCEDTLRDRFAYFRMEKRSSIWGIHVTCSDSATQCIALYLQLDVLEKLKSAFGSGPSEPLPTPPGSTPLLNDLMTDITESISSLNVHVSLDDFIACSWPNQTNHIGVTFSQDSIRLDMKLQQPLTDLSPSTVSSEPVGLEVASIYAEMDHVDVYVRDWSITGNDCSNEECRNVTDLTTLFSAINKLAHATKVKLKYEEEAGSSDHAITTQVPRFHNDFEQNSTSPHLGQAVKPSILSFRANHVILAPPAQCRPLPVARKRKSSHALDLLALSLKRPLPAREPSIRVNSDDASKIPKIWDVKIVDFRLLWTTELREYLSIYATYFSKVLVPQKVPQDADTPQTGDPTTNDRLVSTGHINRSASMDDSLIARNSSTLAAITESVDTHCEEETQAAQSTPKRSGRTTDKATINDFLKDSARRRDPSNKHGDDTTLQSLQKRKSEGPDLVSHYLHTPLAESTRVPGSTATHVTPPHQSSSKKLRRGKNRRMSIKDMNMALDDLGESVDQVGGPFALKESSNVSAASAPGLNSRLLAGRSISVDNSVLDSNSRKEDKRRGEAKIRAKYYFEKFVSVELEDPQVNFLDQNTQSSLVIVVSGASTLVGKRHQAAIVTVQGLGLDEIEEPKKKVNIMLRMDGVSAFTVSTASEEATNIVHWKALDRTEVTHLGERRHSKVEKGHMASFDVSCRRMSSSRRALYSEHSDNLSTSLQKAIDNFQIIAKYTYYEDITVAEASRMHIHRTREELMSAFMLDLPELCLKIDAGQFYTFINAIRNVLLAPPPAKGDKEADEELDNADKKAGVVRMRSLGATRASIDTKSGRNEIRSIVEQNLASIPEGELCLAQSVEYFIGRGTWLLCADNSPHEVLLEVGFMGLLGTHSFHEDRCGIPSPICGFIDVSAMWLSVFVSLR